jgi:hypothetical protein
VPLPGTPGFRARRQAFILERKTHVKTNHYEAVRGRQAHTPTIRARIVALAAALACGGNVWAATKADAEFVANWDAVVGYCSALKPGEAAQYKQGQAIVFKSAPTALVSDARLRPEYKTRYDATLKQLRKGNASPVAATCSKWQSAVNGPRPANITDRR